jgi:metallo-beta-lactamase family protein
MDFFGRVAGYTTPMDITPGICATFLDAGHILGSASIYLELVEEGKRQTILFSGDLGYNGRVILRDPSIPPRAQVVVMETTYGDRVHKPLQPSIEELYGAIEDTFRRGGNVVIPTFALERAQEILYFLHEGVAKGRLPTSMQVFLDSPMAISATEIFERHPECYDAETAKLLSDNQDPFSLPGLHLTRETAQSMAVNNVRGGAVIMAGSGMCTSGRVRHHLKHNLWRPESSVIFVGYAARGTLARRIVDGARTVRIYHEDIPVRAKIFTIGGFSAHADQAELLAWHRQTGNPERTFLVHGDKEVMSNFAAKLSGTQVEMPGLHQEFTL